MKKSFAILFTILLLNSSVFTLNSSAQWVQSNGPYGGDIRCLAALGTYIYAGSFGGGVFVSANNGGTWTESGLNGITLSVLAVSGTNIIAGTFSSGIFLSTNNGTN